MTPELISKFTDRKLGLTFIIEPPVPAPPSVELSSIGEVFSLAVCENRREPLFSSLSCGRDLDGVIGKLGDTVTVGEFVASAFLANGGRRKATTLVPEPLELAA